MVQQQEVPKTPTTNLQARLLEISAYDHIVVDPSATGELGTLRRGGAAVGVTEDQAKWLVRQFSTVNDVEVTGIDRGVIAEEQAAEMKRVGVTEIAPGTDTSVASQVLPPPQAGRPPVKPGEPPYDDDEPQPQAKTATVTVTAVPQSPPQPNLNAPLPKELESKIDG